MLNPLLEVLQCRLILPVFSDIAVWLVERLLEWDIVMRAAASSGADNLVLPGSWKR